MTKIDIFSGFLGAGKTTLIKKLISEAYSGEKLVLIENEFGEIGVDSGFLTDAGVNITEMNSGCICCSLVGDFGRALSQVIEEYHPDRILIEPSGVGKLSDVIRAVRDAAGEGAALSSATAVVDAKKCRMYMKNFGEFFNNQIENAGTIILSHTAGLSHDKVEKAVEMIRSHNESASLVTTEWDEINGGDILAVIEGRDTLAAELHHMEEEAHHHHHDEDCDCGRDGRDGCHDHEHHHHHHDEDCDCCCHDHEHHHNEHKHEHQHEHNHHDHDEECSCGCGGHVHHHHHADEVFTSWGIETAKKFTREEIENALHELENQEKYGMVLRAKGIVAGEDGWIHFDYTPGEGDVRGGSASACGRLCVIGSGIKEDALTELFN